MEGNSENGRKRFLRPGLALLFADLGAVGAICIRPWYASHALAWFAAIATAIFVAQSADGVLSLRESFDDSSPLAFLRRLGLRPQLRLRTLPLIVAVAAILLGLGKWNEASHCCVACIVYAYGFPLRCVYVSYSGSSVSFDFLRLAADLAVGSALVVGIAMEAEHFGGRRWPLTPNGDNDVH